MIKRLRPAIVAECHSPYLAEEIIHDDERELARTEYRDEFVDRDQQSQKKTEGAAHLELGNDESHIDFRRQLK